MECLIDDTAPSWSLLWMKLTRNMNKLVWLNKGVHV